MWVINTTHAASDMLVAPAGQLGDGIFHILLLRGRISRCQLLRMFMELETGAHVQRDEVEIIRARAYRLEPLTERGVLTMDGEVCARMRCPSVRAALTCARARSGWSMGPCSRRCTAAWRG